MKLYLVEDDQADVEAAFRLLKQANFPSLPLTFRDGQEAYEYFQALPEKVNEKHLVLLDLNTPRMNGLEFLRMVRSNPKLKGLNVVVVTTSRLAEDNSSARSLGALDVIDKAELSSRLIPCLEKFRSN